MFFKGVNLIQVQLSLPEISRLTALVILGGYFILNAVIFNAATTGFPFTDFAVFVQSAVVGLFLGVGTAPIWSKYATLIIAYFYFAIVGAVIFAGQPLIGSAVLMMISVGTACGSAAVRAFVSFLGVGLPGRYLMKDGLFFTFIISIWIIAVKDITHSAVVTGLPISTVLSVYLVAGNYIVAAIIASLPLIVDLKKCFGVWVSVIICAILIFLFSRILQNVVSDRHVFSGMILAFMPPLIFACIFWVFVYPLELSLRKAGFQLFRKALPKPFSLKDM